MTGKTRLRNDLCVDGDVKPYQLTNSSSIYYIYRSHNQNRLTGWFLHRGKRTDGNPSIVGRYENHSVESGVPPKLRFGARGRHLGLTPSVQLLCFSVLSKAALRSMKAILCNSFLLWMTVFSVTILLIADRPCVNPLYSFLQCARSWSKILLSSTVANTFLGTDRRVMPPYFLQSFELPFPL